MLQSMGLQRVGHDWATELNWEYISQISDWNTKSQWDISTASLLGWRAGPPALLLSKAHLFCKECSDRVHVYPQEQATVNRHRLFKHRMTQVHLKMKILTHSTCSSNSYSPSLLYFHEWYPRNSVFHANSLHLILSSSLFSPSTLNASAILTGSSPSGAKVLHIS